MELLGELFTKFDKNFRFMEKEWLVLPTGVHASRGARRNIRPVYASCRWRGHGVERRLTEKGAADGRMIFPSSSLACETQTDSVRQEGTRPQLPDVGPSASLE
jgi:hypothetical protein